VGSIPTPGTIYESPSCTVQEKRKGRGTRAGGWGRGEEPNPGPTMTGERSHSEVPPWTFPVTADCSYIVEVETGNNGG
jgi:hypothetical protein